MKVNKPAPCKVYTKLVLWALINLPRRYSSLENETNVSTRTLAEVFLHSLHDDRKRRTHSFLFRGPR